MAEFLTEFLRRHLGWCPHATPSKTLTSPAPGFDNPARTPAPTRPIAQEPVIGNPSEHRPEYQENILLILLFLGGLFFGLKDILTFGGFTILCCVCVYFDAQSIHAGAKFKRVSLLGEVATWQPITWAAAVLAGSFIGMAIYLFCRQEIFNANT